ncbi:MAG: DUF504 domain-containing protein [Methanomicrobiales archaeon]|nr:DUF504 domain-containing protein [Methanomicrobiales archaeon]
MRKSRELLLRIYHDPRCRFGEVVVCYIDRGAPGDESCVEGVRIRELDSQYMEIESAVGVSPIPYHRITRILYAGKTAWERGARGQH